MNISVVGLYRGYYMGWAKLPLPASIETRVREAFQELFNWRLSRQIKPVTHRVFPLADFADALEMISSWQVIGRVALSTQ